VAFGLKSVVAPVKRYFVALEKTLEESQILHRKKYTPGQKKLALKRASYKEGE
jgi:hypothetical protein